MIFMVLALVVMNQLPQTLSAQTINLLVNGGFENNESGWSGWSSGTNVTDADYYTGAHCANFITKGTLEQSPITVVPGKTYKLGAWIKINSMAGNDWGGVRLYAVEYNWSNGYSSEFLTPQNRPAGQWFHEIISFTPSTAAIRVQAGFFGGPGWTADFSVDEIVLTGEPVFNAGPVIDSLVLSGNSGMVPFTVSGQIIAHDPDGAIENYIIDMGDGAVYAGDQAFVHTYRIPGNYTLRVSVTDDAGAYSTELRPIQAAGTSPHAISILQPQAWEGNQFHTSSGSITITGTRYNGSGDIFWINSRSMQSGYVPVISDTFRILDLNLMPGKNAIRVQSSQGNGTNLKDEIVVSYVPAGYSGPEIAGITATKTTVKQYERTDITFSLRTVADNLFFPYDTLMPANLNTGNGVSVDMVFSNGAIVKRQPAFLNMDFIRTGDHLMPTGHFVWTVRMAFRETGTWSSTIIARDSAGTKQVNGPVITVLADTLNPGYLRVSAADNRYFEFENGKPFIAMGYGTSVSGPVQVDAQMADWKKNDLNFSRFWLSGVSPFSDPWSSWATHHQMTGNGYMPPPLLTFNQKCGNGKFSYRIASPAVDNVNTPAIFRGFWDGTTYVKPGQLYRITARVKTIGVTGNGGLVMKTGGWLGTSVVNPGVGVVMSPYMKGDNGWSYLVGTIQTGSSQSALENLYLVLEDCTGEAFLDEMQIQAVNAGGSLDDNILCKWNANSHQYLDPIRCKEADYMIDTANRSGIHYKVVIQEKNDYISNHIDKAGFVTTNKGSFDQPAGSGLHRLYEYFWRNLVARWGYATSVHSWELVNEGAPASYPDLTNDLADYFDTRSPYPRMVSTSFWSNWEPGYWKDSHADYADIHAYVMTTGWIDTMTIDGVLYNREALKNDAAAALYAYSVTTGTDPQRNKPVILGETDLDMSGSQSPDPMLALDTAGVWLHNFNWAHISHGGLTGLIWNTENIRNNNLSYRYRGFSSFMSGIPLTTGQYRKIDAVSSNPLLRVWGQAQASGNAAHLWIQNRYHTWKKVVTLGNPAPENGIITISGLAPGNFQLERWDSWNEDTIAGSKEMVTVNASGILQIQVDSLVADIAFKLSGGGTGIVPVVSQDWPQFQKDAARSGRTTSSVAPPFRARWIWAGPGRTLRNKESRPGWHDDLTTRDGYSFPIPDTVGFTIAGSVQPVVKGGRLYFCTMEGDAYALDIHDGTTLWHASVPGGSMVSAGVADDKVIFAGVTGTVYAFDTATGDPRWQYNSRGAITTAPCIISNSLVTANHKGKVFRISASGNLLWEQNLRIPVTGGIAADGNSVYIPAENLVVYALNLSDGSTRASHQVKGQSFRLCHPVIHNGRIWVTSCAVAEMGSEYIMEDVMASSGSLADEQANIRRWLQGDNNGGTWLNASPDWQHIFALDTLSLEEPFLVPAGPVDGCGFPAPSAALDNTGRVLCWWKTRYPKLTAAGPAFGTNYSLDIAGINQANGNRIPIDNGQFSGMFPLETDNLYALSTGGDYLWLRQHFRGTQVINLNTSQYVLAQVTTRYSDGGNFSGAHICYRNQNPGNNGPYLTTQQSTMGRTAAVITGNYVFLAEEFGIVAIEHY